MEAPESRRMSRSDYLEWSKSQTLRHEWINDEVYAMSGGRPLHSAVKVNLTLTLGAALRGNPCRLADSDQRLFVSATEASLYPDLTVICGPWTVDRADPLAIVNPTLVAEVLSPSTTSYDTGAKLNHYVRVPSLQHILYVTPDPEAQHVIHYQRTPAGWLRTDHHEGSVELTALGVTLELAAVYGNLENVPTT